MAAPEPRRPLDDGHGSRIDPRHISDFARSTLQVMEPEALLEHIADHLRRLFGADLVLLFQVDPQSGDFLPIYSIGYERELLAGAGFSSQGRLADWFHSNEQCLSLSEELQLLEHLDPWELQLLGRLNAQVCMPLVALKRLIGLVLLGSTDPSWKMSKDDFDLLNVLATQSALALENAHLVSQGRERLSRLQLNERLATLGELAAGVAHEIRNPLTAISSTIQYVAFQLPESDSRRELLQDLLGEVSRIHQTVEGLLKLARKDELWLEEQDLLDVIDQVLLLVEAQARQHGVEVDKVYGAERFGVRVDADKLKQVFLNLFQNALHAMPDGGRLVVRVDPWLHPFSSGDRRVQVRISDTGYGIEPEQMAHIFDPFFTTKPDGTGLGLAICQSILERHQGDIELESAPGRGTTVRVCLPLLD